MSGIVLTVVVLAVVMAATIAVSLLLLRRFGDKAERRADELRAEVDASGEGWALPLEGAVYESGPGARGDRGHGVLGLTGRRLLFLPIAGRRFSMPRSRITDARVEDRRRDAAAAHRHLLVLALDDGSSLTFLVDDPVAWLAALTPDDPAANGPAPEA
jgi:hypothetical protein